jgi:hypothetical protein
VTHPPGGVDSIVKESTTADLVNVNTIKVLPISLMLAFEALRDINEAELADKLCEFLLW